MAWDVEVTDEFLEWLEALEDVEWDSIVLAVNILQSQGPMLGSPFVDNVHNSRHSNMKELRPLSSNLRVFFAFDPRRTAILLLGGDKSGRWNRWYDQMIPIADQLCDEYLEEIRREGLLP